MVAIGTRGVVVVALIVASRWGSQARKAALLGAAAGLIWAIDAAFVKATTDVLAREGWSGVFVHWPVYGAVLSGVLGTIVLEAAFAVGPLSASQSALLIVDPLASIIIGIELFGETLNNSPLAITLCALFLTGMFAGVVLLSIWTPPSMQRRPRRPGRRPEHAAE